MIALALAQQAAFVMQPYSGVAPAYEVRCELQLPDQTKQLVTVSMRGSGAERSATLQINGVKTEAQSHLTAIGEDRSGNVLVDEAFMVPNDAAPEYLYRYQYLMPKPEPQLRIELLKFENKRGAHYAMGTCQVTEATQ